MSKIERELPRITSEGFVWSDLDMACVPLGDVGFVFRDVADVADNLPRLSSKEVVRLFLSKERCYAGDAEFNEAVRRAGAALSLPRAVDVGTDAIDSNI